MRSVAEAIGVADGVHIAYEVTGTGSPVVLVHGITECRAAWESVTGLLADSHRVVALDLRGHGDSSRADAYGMDVLASDVAAAIVALDLGEVHIVGHSLGGAVVTFVAAAVPVRTVTNVDQPLRFWEMAELLRPLADTLRGPGFGDVLGQLFADLGVDRVPEPMRSKLDRWHSAADQRVVLGIWEVLLSAPSEEIQNLVETTFAGVTAPYLALHGADPGDGYGDWLRALVPSAVVETWDGLGHYPHLVDPKRFVARLEDHWTTTSQ